MRNFSTNRYFAALAAAHKPRFHFTGTTKAHWRSWRRPLLGALQASLGRMPPKAPLRPEIEAQWEQDGLIGQRVVFDVEKGLSAAAIVLRPRGGGKFPGILACHGHGPYGKDSVMGLGEKPEERAKIAQYNYDYGLKMAKAGYAVIAIDWRGFGERMDAPSAYRMPWLAGRDPCNVDYLRANMLGMTLLGMDIHDGRCALDYLCAQRYVDASRIGAMGLSFGGTMTTWLAFMDDRIRAANVMCYSSSFAAYAMRDTNTCGSQVTPGLYAMCDVSDLQGLIAPKPLLVEIGAYDECFHVGDAMKCFKEVQAVYGAAGAADRLELDLFEGVHRHSGRRTEQFFRRYLGEAGKDAKRRAR